MVPTELNGSAASPNHDYERDVVSRHDAADKRVA